MNMSEWIDFMTATDEGLDSRQNARCVRPLLSCPLL